MLDNQAEPQSCKHPRIYYTVYPDSGTLSGAVCAECGGRWTVDDIDDAIRHAAEWLWAE